MNYIKKLPYRTVVFVESLFLGIYIHYSSPSLIHGSFTRRVLCQVMAVYTNDQPVWLNVSCSCQGREQEKDS